MSHRYVMVKDGKVLTSIVTGKGGIGAYKTKLDKEGNLKYGYVTDWILVDPDDGSMGPYSLENGIKETATWDGVKFTGPDMSKLSPKAVAKKAIRDLPDDAAPTAKQLKAAGLI